MGNCLAPIAHFVRFRRIEHHHTDYVVGSGINHILTLTEEICPAKYEFSVILSFHTPSINTNSSQYWPGFVN